MWEEVVEKTVDVKVKPVYNHPPEKKRSTLDTQKTTDYQLRKIRIKLIKSIGMEIKKRLSLTTPLLLIVNLKPRFLRKTSIIEIVKEAI